MERASALPSETRRSFRAACKELGFDMDALLGRGRFFTIPEHADGEHRRDMRRSEGHLTARLVETFLLLPLRSTLAPRV